MDQMVIESEAGPREGIHVIRLRGPLTLSTLFDFQDVARRETSPVLIVDVSETPYMDSAGLGSLLGIFASCQKTGRKFGLAGVSPRIHTLLEVTHVDKILPAFATVTDAVNGL